MASASSLSLASSSSSEHFSLRTLLFNEYQSLHSSDWQLISDSAGIATYSLKRPEDRHPTLRVTKTIKSDSFEKVFPIEISFFLLFTWILTSYYY